MKEISLRNILIVSFFLIGTTIFWNANTSAESCIDTWIGNNTRNLIVNYDFEQTPDFAGWSGSTSPAGVTTSIDYLTGHDGTATKAAKVTWDGSSVNQNYFHRYQSFDVTPGKTYRLTGYIKTDNISCENTAVSDWNGVRIEVQDPINGWAYFSTATNSVYGTKDWSKISKEFTIPTNTTRINVILRRYVGTQSGLSYGTAWWDDVQLLPVPKISSLTVNGNQITITGESFGDDPGVGNRNTDENCVLFSGSCLADNDVQSWSDSEVVISDPGDGAVRVRSGGIVSNVASTQNGFTLQNNTISIDFPNLPTGMGIRQITHIASGREFLNDTIATLPLYEYTVKDDPFDLSSKTTISSKDASSVTKTYIDMNGTKTLTITASHCNEFIVTATITLPSFQGGAQFSINIRNNGTRAIQSVRYPLIAANYQLGSNSTDDVIVFPYFEGYLLKNPATIDQLINVDPSMYRKYDDIEYPGPMSLQMMAYYDTEQVNAGLYFSVDDNEGNKKRFGFQRINDASGNYILFSFLHNTAENSGNQFAPAYHVNIDTFSGGWLEAAEKYKDWALTQPWTALKLADREDVPSWLYNIKAMIDCYGCRPESSHEYNYEALVNAYRSLLGIPQEPSGVSNFMLYPGGFWGYREGDYNSCHVDWSGIDYFTDDPYYDAQYEPGNPPYTVLSNAINTLRNENTDVLLFIEGLSWDEYFYKPGGSLPACQMLNPDPAVQPIPAELLCFDDRSHFYSHVDNYGNPYIIKNEDGSSRYSFAWPTNYPEDCHLTSYMCVGMDDADSAMDLVLYNNIRRGIDHGARLMSLDAVVGGRIPGCWDSSHGHPIGEGKWTHDRFVQILDEINRIIDQEKNKRGEFGFAMENAHELYLQDLQFQYVRNSALGNMFGARTVGGIQLGGSKKIPLFNYIYKGYYLGVDRGMTLSSSNYLSDRWYLAMDFIQGTVQGTMISSDPDYQPNGDLINFYKRLIDTKRPEFYKAESLFPPVFYGLPNETSLGIWTNSVCNACDDKNFINYDFDMLLTNVFKTGDNSISYLLVNANLDGTGGANISFDITQYDLPSNNVYITVIKEGINGRTQESLIGESLPYQINVDITGGEVVEVRVEVDNDSDGYPSEIDCNDNDPAINPGASDITCNGIDENCNGTADEGYVPTPTTCGVGACSATGQLICVNGSTSDTCTPGAPQSEGYYGDPTCSDSLDNDCDGLTDTDDSGCLLPDLIVSALSNPPSEAVLGGSFDITDTTENIGVGDAAASSTVYYLSRDNIITPSDDTLLTNSRSVPALLHGTGSTGTVTVTIPGNVNPGGYYIGACSDPGNNITESNSDNNCVASTSMIQVRRK